MQRLFDSLMRNYPIQTFLFWRTKDEIKARKFMEQIAWDAALSDFYEPNVSKEGVERFSFSMVNRDYKRFTRYFTAQLPHPITSAPKLISTSQAVRLPTNKA